MVKKVLTAVASETWKESMPTSVEERNGRGNCVGILPITNSDSSYYIIEQLSVDRALNAEDMVLGIVSKLLPSYKSFYLRIRLYVIRLF